MSSMRGVGVQRPRTYDDVQTPANYVAGLGRGAVGFVTRSDIGPARTDPSVGFTKDDRPPPGYVAGAGRGAGASAGAAADTADYSESNFDSFSGYSENLFAGSARDADDEEADTIYAAVDEMTQARRKRSRAEMQKASAAAAKAKGKPVIAGQFADLKRQLGSVSFDEWNSIPEIGDYSLKYKQRRTMNTAMPVPDALLDSARTTGATVAALDPRAAPDSSTPYGGATTATPMSGLSQARGQVLSLRLDKMSDSVSGQTVVDPKGYLTDLNSLKITTDAEIGDLKKARQLLRSVIMTNPKHAPGWIAAARIEEVAGKLVQARKLILKGCEACPDNEDVWLENARLQTPDNARVVLAEAVKRIPHSVKIWMRAAELEEEMETRKLVLRRALEYIPNSVKLWRASVELEEPEDARVMLHRAVECVPRSVDMWLALARLETYENARNVLNKALEHIPTEPSIWITAAQLEEAHGHSHMVERIIQRAVKALSAAQVVIDREQWIKEAEKAEESGSPETCGALVRATIGIGVEDEDRKQTWADDADGARKRERPVTARAIYAHALTVFPNKRSLWLSAVELEKESGTPESTEALLRRAVTAVPTAEILWLMAAKHKWRVMQDVAGARTILQEAFRVNSDSEEIWLAAVKLEWENGEFDRARALLERARTRAPTARVWMKSALLEWETSNVDAERALLEEALTRYPSYEKLWMMLAQLHEESGNDAAAREAYHKGLRLCPASVPMWCLAARLELRTSGAIKARSLLELARLKNKGNEVLWLESVRTELSAGEEALAHALLARALQECPTSGMLRSQEIAMAPRAAQRRKSVDAVKQCDNDVHVVVAVAKMFWRDRKYLKARRWFERAVSLRPDMGDAWAAYYAFELAHGTEEQQEQVAKRCAEVEPNHGESWCAMAKAKENRRLPVVEVLRKVATQVKP